MSCGASHAAGPPSSPDPAGLHFTVEGKDWAYHAKAYLMLHKPAGYECSQKPSAWPSIYTLLPAPLRQRPNKGAQPGVLWSHFAEVVGFDPDGFPPAEARRTNASLGVAETAVLRQLNKKLDRRTRREAAYDGLIRQMLVESVLLAALGGVAGLGTSPGRTMRFFFGRGLVSGTADSSATV